MKKRIISMLLTLFVALSPIITAVYADGTPSESELEQFYTYSEKDGGYEVALSSGFETALNSTPQTPFTCGSITWNPGDALPNPAPDGKYKGKPVTSLNCMFHDCMMTSLNLSGWNTENLTDMGGLFMNCESLTSIDGISN